MAIVYYVYSAVFNKQLNDLFYVQYLFVTN